MLRNILDFLFTCFMVLVLGIWFLGIYVLAVAAVLGALIGVAVLMNP